MQRNIEIKTALEKAFNVLGSDPTKLYIVIANDLCPGYKTINPNGKPDEGTVLGIDNVAREGRFFSFKDNAIIFTVPGACRVAIPYKAIYGAETHSKYNEQLNWTIDPEKPDNMVIDWSTAMHNSQTKH